MNHNQSIKQNQRIQRISETTLVIGVDIAKFNHVARAFNYRGMELGKRCLFYNDESGLLHLLDWIKAIQLEQGYDDVILGIEPTGHYWFPMFHFLKEKGVQVVLVNPHHVKKSKELDDNSPTKNDIKDAKVVASLVRDGRYSTPQLPEGIYADLRVLMNQRDRVYEDLHRVKGRIHNWLDRFFPEYMQVFKGWEGKASLLTLQFFPLPQDVVAAGETVIVNLWKEEIKRAVRTKRAPLLCSKAARSIGITTGATAARHELSMYLELYTMLVKQMDDLMMLVERWYNKSLGL